MVVTIRWSKTNQCSETEMDSPMVGNNHSKICPVWWILYMTDRIPAKPYHNLFCYQNKEGRTVPITYRDLMVNLRQWIEKVGIQNSKKYLTHSLRRGATTQAHGKGIDEKQS